MISGQTLRVCPEENRHPLWLAVIFASFTLFVQPNTIVAMASLVYALLVSSALFLIVDMSQPFSGLMKISSEPLQHVLPPLGV